MIACIYRMLDWYKGVNNIFITYQDDVLHLPRLQPGRCGRATFPTCARWQGAVFKYPNKIAHSDPN